jgi:sulfinoalanine decarboxylase/sulfinoalanine decarboxylase/aspartate 1-decarboxylase
LTESATAIHPLPTRRQERARELEQLLAATAELALGLVADEDRPADPSTADPEPLAARLELALGAEGRTVDAVLGNLRELLRATPSSSSWRFVNQLFGGRIPVATAAEALAAIPNISMYTFKAAGAQVLIERELIHRMAERVGLPGAEGCFTPGGSIANLVALLLARNAAAPEGRDRGLGGTPLTVYTSAEGHYSVRKNAGILGLGRDRVRLVPVDSRGRMDVAALARRIEQDRERGLRPALVNATAGTTVRGAFDPLAEIAAVAREHGVRLHVDGAFGGSLALSATRRSLLDGAGLADSFSWDPHKMMGVTLQCSVLLVARRGELAASLDETADYLYQADDDELNPGHRSIQCGRRNDVLKLWAAWLRLGDRGWEARLERQLALAARAAQRVAADPALHLLEPPMSINVCFEVRGRSTAAICDRLDREGRLKIGHGIVSGRRALRLVCVNPDLDEGDLDAILGEIKAVAAGLPEADNRVAPDEEPGGAESDFDDD